MAPIAFPSVSRSADAFSVVGITSPVAARGVQASVARDAALDDLTESGRELARLLLADEAGERLLDHLVAAEPEELRDGLVRLEDLPLEVGDEHRVRRVFDQPLCATRGPCRARACLRRIPMAPITLPSASRSAEAFRLVGITSPEALRGFSTASRRDAALDDLAERGGELPCLLLANEA